jgi:predicted  nucleic acid-binding Zn-ribbon protein
MALTQGSHKATSGSKHQQKIGIVDFQQKLHALKLLYGNISTDRELATLIIADDGAPANGDNLRDEVVHLLVHQWPHNKPTKFAVRSKNRTRATKNYSSRYSQRVLEQINAKIKEEAPLHPKQMTNREWGSNPHYAAL